MLKKLARKWLKPNLHRAEIQEHYEVLGTVYGAWPLITRDLNSETVIYSFGVGEDISFDQAALSLLGCKVEAFDPTPRSRAWVERQSLPENFRFHPVGIAAEDGQVLFFEPARDDYVSFSDSPSPNASGNVVRAPVKRLQTIVDDLGGGPPDILKMDIEGFEYGVIKDILGFTSIRPRQWLIEFHHGMYSKSRDDTRRAVNMLKESGYDIFYVSETGREYGFVSRTADDSTRNLSHSSHVIS